jgi:rhodanese-related sulfurtransferase
VRVDEVADAFLLDVREDDEWTEGHAPQAVHVPMYDVPQRLDVLPAEGPIAVICHVGARSAQVAHWLRAQGFDAHNVDGGMIAWAAAGLRIESTSSAEGSAG